MAKNAKIPGFECPVLAKLLMFAKEELKILLYCSRNLERITHIDF